MSRVELFPCFQAEPTASCSPPRPFVLDSCAASSCLFSPGFHISNHKGKKKSKKKPGSMERYFSVHTTKPLPRFDVPPWPGSCQQGIFTGGFSTLAHTFSPDTHPFLHSQCPANGSLHSMHPFPAEATTTLARGLQGLRESWTGLGLKEL